MSENLDQTAAQAPAKKRWRIIVAATALLATVIIVALMLRQPAKPTGMAGREVPSVESVSGPMAGRAVPTVEESGGATSPGKADLTLPPEMLERIALQFAEVGIRTVANQLRTTGTIQANAYKETRVMPLVSGQITEVKVQLGDFVKKGQLLAKIYSTELAQEQMEYLRVDANLGVHEAQARRYRKLAEIGAISEQEKEEIEARLQEHHAEHASHRQKLLLLGMTDAQIDRLTDASKVHSEVPTIAPSSGVITARGVNNGQVIAMTDSLFSVTDLSSVWVIGNIYEKDFGVLRLGAKVLITTPSYPGRNFQGVISYIDPNIDTNSRTAQIRIEVPNPGQMLKLGMFVDVALNASGVQEAVVIPKAAVQTIGNDQIVFVALGAGQFQMRKLQLAEDIGDLVRVVSGLSVGEKIVTEGSFFLRAELGRLGN